MVAYLDSAYDLETVSPPLVRLTPEGGNTQLAVLWPPGSDGSSIRFDGVDSAFSERGNSHLREVVVYVSIYGNYSSPPTITARLYLSDESASASGSAVAEWTYVSTPGDWGPGMPVLLTLPAQAEADALFDAAFDVYWNGNENAIRLEVSLSDIHISTSAYPDPTGGLLVDDVWVLMRTGPALVSRTSDALFK